MDLPPDPDQTWNLLPAELKMKILSYLSPEDLEAAGLTNQDFHQNADQIYDTHIDYWVAELAQQLDVLEPLVYSGPADEVAAALERAKAMYDQLETILGEKNGAWAPWPEALDPLKVRYLSLSRTAKESHNLT